MEPETELAELRSRVSTLEAQLATLLTERGVTAHAVASDHPGAPDPGVNRRRVLRHGLGLGAAAVAGVGTVGALAGPAAAASGDAVLVARDVAPNLSSDAPTRIHNPSSETHADVLFRVDNTTNDELAPDDTQAAILATFDGSDLNPKRSAAILGRSQYDAGVQGYSYLYAGVVGTSENAVGVLGISTSDTGVSGTSSFGAGVMATSHSGTALVATSTEGDAIHGSATYQVGVVGEATTGFGVAGNAPSGVGVGGSGSIGVMASGVDVGVQATGSVAVSGTSKDGTGVEAKSTTGPALVAMSVFGPAMTANAVIRVTSENGALEATSTSVGPAITVANQGGGTGIQVNTTHPGAGAAIVASTTNDGSAVIGLVSKKSGTQPAGEFGTSGHGVGLEVYSLRGVAANFLGDRAAVRLQPQKKKGQPRNGHHLRGELLVDAGGRLWLCTKDGTPGSWRKVALV